MTHITEQEVYRFIGTANHGFAQYAQEEIRRLFPNAKCKPIVPAELFLFDIRGEADPASIVHTIRTHEPMFLRHMQPVQREWDVTGTAADLETLRSYAAKELSFTAGEKVAVQVRKQEGLSLPFTPFDVKAALDEVLTATQHVESVVRGADWIVSVFFAETRMYAGVSRPEDNLSDWSGGAVRFQKEENQISRAKFKLLEAEQRFGLDFSRFETALDIGAAPGGWTSLLLERGLRVTAVDPAALHPSLLPSRKLTFLKKNAGEVSFKPDTFDLLVCDMSWSPRQMGRLVLDLLYALRVGGTAIITVKLMHKKPFQTVRELLELFSPVLELQRAKQLFHNREELTMYLIKKQQ